ncbi:MAG TPA: type I polyketide synthase, partial [Herpetosiphonaceae bacterium]
MTSSAVETGLEIAIIGIAGRFPGAPTLDIFWNNLRDGIESITRFDQADAAESEIVKASAVLDDIEHFDAAFFGMSPREAEILDPQQRLFLECAWEAIESAGYNLQRYDGSVGVYAGVGINTYLLKNLYSNPNLIDLIGEAQIKHGNDKDFLATRVSYLLNLDGPSVVVQTACSTSLVAVHLACRSLLSGECDMALAGGASIRTPQESGYAYREGGITAPDGHCRAFDEQAHGTVFGNGVGVVLLKRLEDALADGDTIHAVIKGSAINNDGSNKVGFTAPGVEGQTKVIQAAYMMAEVEPESVSYVETHGTGTKLGDPLEITALTRAFRQSTEQEQFCAIGALKPNIGHLDTAAGVAGLIKATLALKHREIPPLLHFERANPAIDFASSPFYVTTEAAAWHRNGTPRRAGVSAFGIGGTNAHVVLEEAPAPAESGESRPWQLLPISTKTAAALEAATTNLAAHLKQSPELSLADVAYTLQVGRQPFAHRRFVLCRSQDEAIAALEGSESGRVFGGVAERER